MQNKEKDETKFISLLKIMKIRNIFLNYSFFISFFLTLFFTFYISDLKGLNELTSFFSTTIASISSTLLGIVIAGLAILIALSQGEILGILRQRKILHKFLFPFWILSGSWSISTLLSLVLFIIKNHTIAEIVLSISAFIFLFSLFQTVSLMGHAIRLGIFLSDIYSDDD